MTARELRQAQERYIFLTRQAKADRDQVVLRAIKAGMTHAQIAEATGLTRGRIGQIATGR